MIDPKEKKTIIDEEGEETEDFLPVNNIDNENEEIYSDGSGDAFEQTERVEEDNFDDLREK